MTCTLYWARILDREECTLYRAENSLERKKVTRFFASSFPPYFPNALTQVTSMEEAVNSAWCSRARAGMSIPRRR